MLCAFWFMHAKGPRHSRNHVNSRLYESLKVEFRKVVNTRNSQQTGKNNPFFGKKHSVLTRRKLSFISGGNGQVEGLFEYFDEKFDNLLSKPLVNIKKKKSTNMNLDFVLSNLMV